MHWTEAKLATVSAQGVLWAYVPVDPTFIVLNVYLVEFLRLEIFVEHQ